MSDCFFSCFHPASSTSSSKGIHLKVNIHQSWSPSKSSPAFILKVASGAPGCSTGFFVAWRSGEKNLPFVNPKYPKNF